MFFRLVVNIYLVGDSGSNWPLRDCTEELRFLGEISTSNSIRVQQLWSAGFFFVLKVDDKVIVGPISRRGWLKAILPISRCRGYSPFAIMMEALI